MQRLGKGGNQGAHDGAKSRWGRTGGSLVGRCAAVRRYGYEAVEVPTHAPDAAARFIASITATAGRRYFARRLEFCPAVA